MKKWYNVEIGYSTRTMIDRVNNFVFFLQDNNIKYHTAEAGNMIHFEIELTEEEVETVNNALDTMVFFDSIVNA